MRLGNAKQSYDAARKAQIVYAIEELLESVAFNQIGVTDICHQAGISRPTFYRYFKDKFDIVQWLWDTKGTKYFDEMGDMVDSESWARGLADGLYFLKEHQALFSAAFVSDEDYNSCMAYGRRRMTESMLAAVSRRNPAALNDGVRFQISFFVIATSEEMRRWLISGAKEDPKTMARYLSSCVPAELYFALRIQ